MEHDDGSADEKRILGKSSFDEPLMPVLFARSLASVDPDMADALAIVPWRGGTVDLEDAAIGEADAVVAYGSSHTTEAIRPRVRAGKERLPQLRRENRLLADRPRGASR